MWALANPKIGEREVLAATLEVDADLVARREGTLLITDKGFASKPFEQDLVTQGIELLRPSLKQDEEALRRADAQEGPPADRVGQRHIKGQLDLERRSGRTFEGVAVRVTQRVLTMAVGIWHNNLTGAAVTRSLVTYGR